MPETTRMVHRCPVTVDPRGGEIAPAGQVLVVPVGNPVEFTNLIRNTSDGSDLANLSNRRVRVNPSVAGHLIPEIGPPR